MAGEAREVQGERDIWLIVTVLVLPRIWGRSVHLAFVSLIPSRRYNSPVRLGTLPLTAKPQFLSPGASVQVLRNRPPPLLLVIAIPRHIQQICALSTAEHLGPPIAFLS